MDVSEPVAAATGRRWQGLGPGADRSLRGLPGDQCGIGLITDTWKLPTDWLARTPFDSWVGPGLDPDRAGSRPTGAGGHPEAVFCPRRPGLGILAGLLAGANLLIWIGPAARRAADLLLPAAGDRGNRRTGGRPGPVVAGRPAAFARTRLMAGDDMSSARPRLIAVGVLLPVLVIVAAGYGLSAPDAYCEATELQRQTWRAQDAVNLGAALVLFPQLPAISCRLLARAPWFSWECWAGWPTARCTWRSGQSSTRSSWSTWRWSDWPASGCSMDSSESNWPRSRSCPGSPSSGRRPSSWL